METKSGKKQSWIKLIMKYNRFLENILLLLGVLILSIVLGKNIVFANTVWELADEAGYLSNVAYFLGYKWDDVRAVMPFYGYGYSVFLIPVYLLADTGVQLIKGSMCVNLFFTIGTYLIIIYLLENVGEQNNRMLTSIISLITCLSSYLCCNVLKVNCESLSTFWYCLVVLMLYKTIKTKKKCWYALLALASSYMFFIHTRMIVLIVALILTICIDAFIYHNDDIKDNIYNLILFAIFFSVSFIVMYIIKQSLIHSASALSRSEITEVNLINKDYIFNRIRWLFSFDNFKLYFISFLSKCYYAVIVSCGTIILGYISICQSLRYGWKKKKDRTLWSVKLFLILGTTIMLIACTVNGAGTLSDFCYFFYSRYYENVIILMIAFGISSTITKKWPNKIYFICIFVSILLGINVSDLSNYLHSNNIRMDTARIPGLSWLVKNTDNFYEMILFGTTLIVFIYGIFFLTRKMKSKGFFILLILFFMVWKSTLLGINIIADVHENHKMDAAIADYIKKNSECNIVFMIDDDSYRFSGFYSRMQVLLKDIPLKVIKVYELDKGYDIPDDAWVLSYKENTVRNTYLSDMQYIMDGAVFELWKNK